MVTAIKGLQQTLCFILTAKRNSSLRLWSPSPLYTTQYLFEPPNPSCTQPSNFLVNRELHKAKSRQDYIKRNDLLNSTIHKTHQTLNLIEGPVTLNSNPKCSEPHQPKKGSPSRLTIIDSTNPNHKAMCPHPFLQVSLLENPPWSIFLAEKPVLKSASSFLSLGMLCSTLHLKNTQILLTSNWTYPIIFCPFHPEDNILHCNIKANRTKHVTWFRSL